MEFSLSGNLVDVHAREIYSARISIVDGKIASIEKTSKPVDAKFIMPGFVDSHIHVESSMLLPGEFANVAVIHGTVATVSDPHEIANVCGLNGVELMLRNASQTKFKFCFGAPSCVPATVFETAGAKLDAVDTAKLMADPRIGYLSEMMDFPGVLSGDQEVAAKIKSALDLGKPVDGHAPGLRGEDAAKYVAAGITTDHECFTREEAIDKLKAGCKIAIREGSAARNFDALQTLIDDYPESCMLCSDDKHPDEFLLGHINQLVARAIREGRDLMNVLTVACVNPVNHYDLDVGLLRVGDPADFIVVDDLTDFKVAATYLDGELVAENGNSLLTVPTSETVNNFSATPFNAEQLAVKAESSTIRVIEAIDGQLITNHLTQPCPIADGMATADVDNDILKIVVCNRYESTEPSIAFVTGFGLKSGAIASSVAHDSHNIVAVGTNDDDLIAAINAVVEKQGGLSVSVDGKTDVLPLPVAGLMSTGSCQEVGEKYSMLNQNVKTMGTNLRAPYMTLSFMSLLVISSLKISDKGLFDVDKFDFVPLFV